MADTLDATATPAQGEPAGASLAPALDIDAQIEQAYQAAMAEAEAGDATAPDPQADTAGATSGEPAASPEAAPEPDAAAEQLLANDPEFAALSRSQRGKLIAALKKSSDEANQRATAAQQEADQLRQRAEQQTAHLRERAAELEAFIGSEEEFAALKEKGLDGDWDATAQYREFEQRRKFQDLFDAIAHGKIAVALEDVAKEYAGMEPAEVRQSKAFPEALMRVVKAVQKRSDDKYEGQLREKDAQLAAEKAAHEGTRLRATGSGLQPETGGSGSGGLGLGAYLGKDGYPTEEAIALAKQGGLAGLNLGQ